MNQDSEIWLQLKNGEASALKSIYDRYAERLFQYGSRFTPDTMLVEDCMHDLFVSIWSNRATLGNTNSIMGYLCISLRREIIRRLSKPDHTEAEISDAVVFSAIPSHEDNLILDEKRQEQKQKLDAAFANLSERQKEALYLRYFEGMEYDKICEIMQINYQSVRNLISRAVHQIRDNWLVLLSGWIFELIKASGEYKNMVSDLFN